MEFLIITVPNGQLSPHLDALKSGDDVYVGKEPAGFMTLNEIPASGSDLWLPSTGTAIGPFLAMLEDVVTQQRFEQLVLVHAVRTADELVYQEKIEQLSQAGALAKAAKVELTPDSSFFYLCGNPDMVRDTSEVLSQLGYQKHLRRKAGHFSSENYW